jgi:hypothetical protein
VTPDNLNLLALLPLPKRSQKRLEPWLQRYSASLAGAKPQVQTPVPPKKKRKEKKQNKTTQLTFPTEIVWGRSDPRNGLSSWCCFTLSFAALRFPHVAGVHSSAIYLAVSFSRCYIIKRWSSVHLFLTVV